MAGGRLNTILLHIAGALTATFLAGSACGQTATDACSLTAGAKYPVNSSCVYQGFDKPTAFVGNVTATGCNGSNNDDAFGWFTATSTSTTVSYFTNVFGTDPIIHVYTGTCGALSAFGCVNATGAVPFLGSATETLVLTTVIGQNYIVRIQNRGSNNSMTGSLCVWSPPPPPANDNCNAAIDLIVFSACFDQPFTNFGATASGTNPAPACSTAPTTDVWFRFVAPASGAVTIATSAGTLSDGAFQVYSGSCGSLALVPSGCDDDSGPGSMPLLDRRCTPLTGGQTYYIRFWGYNGATGTFGICVYGPDVYPTPQQDCGGGFTVCNSSSINNSSNWTGCVADLTSTNRGCLGSNERQGTWYYFSPQATGTVGFSLQPIDNMGVPTNVDYDFAIWGPMNNVVCPPASGPTRCSYAAPGSAGTYLTGMATGNVDVSEAASGAGVNGFTAPLTIGAAQVGKLYIMYLDNYSLSGQAFNLTWGLSGGASLDCTLLPVEMTSFKAEATGTAVRAVWSTVSEHASSHFIVERSMDGESFAAIGRLDAAGSSNSRVDYEWIDTAPLSGVNYYRLQQVDLDGTMTASQIVSVLFRSSNGTLLIQPNPASSAVWVTVPAGTEGSISVTICDATGRIVLMQNSMDAPSNGLLHAPVDQLPIGAYLLHVNDRSGRRMGVARFLKQ